MSTSEPRPRHPSGSKNANMGKPYLYLLLWGSQARRLSKKATCSASAKWSQLRGSQPTSHRKCPSALTTMRITEWDPTTSSHRLSASQLRCLTLFNTMFLRRGVWEVLLKEKIKMQRYIYEMVLFLWCCVHVIVETEFHYVQDQSWAPAILLPQPPKQLGLQVCTTTPGLKISFL
jgi:hypothetical protein